MAQKRVGGIIQFTANGVLYNAKGAFTYNLGQPKRESVAGADGIHGYKETPQPAFIEGEITDQSDLDLKALVTLQGATVSLQLANGKVITLGDAWYASEGTGNTEEGAIPVRFESSSGEEIS